MGDPLGLVVSRSAALASYARRRATRNGSCGNFASDYRAGPDLGSRSYECTWKKNRSHADIAAVACLNERKLQRCVDDRSGNRRLGVCGGENDHSRADPSSASDPDAARAVHVAVRTDPGALLDAQLPACVAAEHRAMADVDVTCDVHMGRVEDQHALLDHRPLAERAEIRRNVAAAAVRSCGHCAQG